MTLLGTVATERIDSITPFPDCPMPDRVDGIPEFVAAIADRYRFDREIGRGGMGAVYLADDLKLGRRVAIKVLPPERATVINTSRFLRELRLMARMQHPGVVTVHDSGQVAGVHYYVMPYVPGESLRHRLDRERQLSVTDTTRILRDLLQALAYVHASGVVHRDIKPENVLLLSGQALLTDFGIARPVNAATPLTPLAFTVGTVTYMPPEQHAGSAVDHRADLFAVGVMTYEMLMGSRPFLTEWELQRRPPVPIRSRRPDVPLAIELAVMRCLEKRADDRWNSADELLAFVESVGVGARATEV